MKSQQIKGTKDSIKKEDLRTDHSGIMEQSIDIDGNPQRSFGIIKRLSGYFGRNFSIDQKEREKSSWRQVGTDPTIYNHTIRYQVFPVYE